MVPQTQAWKSILTLPGPTFRFLQYSVLLLSSEIPIPTSCEKEDHNSPKFTAHHQRNPLFKIWASHNVPSAVLLSTNLKTWISLKMKKNNSHCKTNLSIKLSSFKIKVWVSSTVWHHITLDGGYSVLVYRLAKKLHLIST